MDAVQIQCIQQCDDIFPELLDRIRARRGRGLSVASRVVTQDTEILTKLVSLRVPHGIIRPEGIREHQYGFSALTFQRVMDAGISGFEDRHFEYFSPAGILPRRAAKPDSGNGSFPAKLDAFQDQGNSLAYADAHGAERISAVGAPALGLTCVASSGIFNSRSTASA